MDQDNNSGNSSGGYGGTEDAFAVPVHFGGTTYPEEKIEETQTEQQMPEEQNLEHHKIVIQPPAPEPESQPEPEPEQTRDFIRPNVDVVQPPVEPKPEITPPVAMQPSEPVAPAEPKPPVSASSIYPDANENHSFRQGPNLSQKTPAVSSGGLESMGDDKPVPVVKVLSVRGVEYAMMTFLLWIGAGTLIYTLVSLILGNNSFDMLAFPASVMLVCLPIFAYFFLRLRSAELSNPSLRLEPSKRRFSQLTQFLAFFTIIANLISLVYVFIGMAGGNEVGSIGKVLGSAFVVLVIAGGIFAYYWFDEHRGVGQ